MCHFRPREVYIDRGDKQQNKEIFDTLIAKKSEIEQIFGNTLAWERLDDKRACRIKAMVNSGGYRNPESEWHAIQLEMVEMMIRLEAALKGPIEALNL